MRISGRVFWSVMAVAAISRLLAMAILPLADTSEPRYAEVARLMAQSNDWITPWFEPGVPFWGKPPLAFWAQALSIKLFGTGEFAVRMPAFLAMAATLAMIYSFARSMFGLSAARWAALVLATMLLPLLSAGAVLTDPFLALAVTLAMLSFMRATEGGGRWYRGLGLFIGLALGMLAKGPLAVVLIGGVCAAWLLWQGGWRKHLRTLPWAIGITSTLLLAIPWYVAAESKTPGFLQYFIVGEHYLRFVDSGWGGDRYGNAHARAWGAIWLDWIAASAPWSIVALAACATALSRRAARHTMHVALADGRLRFLLLWTLAAPVLFTLSGNILWTYVLPGLPAAALLLGYWISGLTLANPRMVRRALLGMTMLVPATAMVLSARAIIDPRRLKTEKGLVRAAVTAKGPDESLYYVGSRPFSARYYSQGKARLLPWDTPDLRQACASGRMLAAVPRDRAWPKMTEPGIKAQRLYSSRRYTLYEIRGCR